VKIQLKRSNVLEGGVAKEPTAAQMEYGELAVNYSNSDPAVFLKDSNDNIIRIAGAGAASGGLPNGGSGERPGSPTVGDLFFDTDLNLIVYWNGNQWVPVSPGVIVSDSKPTESLHAAGTLWYNSDEAEGALYILYEDPAGPDADAGGKIWVQIAGGSGSSGSSVIVADTPPNTADEGDLWFDSGDGRLYIWYVNANSQGQWVDASPDSSGGNDIDGSDFVSKTDTNSQNIESDLTLGTDKITLDATDGSATFDGPVFSGSDTNHGYYFCNAPSEGYSAFICRHANSGGNNTVEIGFDGSAKFAGDITKKRSDNTASACIIRDDYLRIYDNPVSYDDYKISLNTDGSAKFAGDVVAGSNAPDATGPGATVSAGGAFAACRNQYNQGVFFGYTTGDTSPTSYINAGGSATFDGEVNTKLYYTVSTPGGGYASFQTGANLGPSISTGGLYRDIEFYTGNGSTEILHTTFRADGTTTFRNAILNLEPDNDANYTTTTEEYTETESYTGPLGNTLEREVTKTRDVRTYIGPTLDVKDRLQNLISRLDALEADEISDDAASNALLTLIGSLTARVDARDAVIADLTARIQTLEGGN
jgi:hypothetical protein